MAGTWKWYGKGLLGAVTGLIDFDTDTFYVMLTGQVSGGYDPDVVQDTAEFRSGVTNEVSPSGTYATGGKTAGTTTVSYDAATNEVRILWADVQWTGATIAAQTAVLYKYTGSGAGSDRLVAYCKEAAVVNSTAGTFTVDMPATAVLKITAA